MPAHLYLDAIGISYQTLSFPPGTVKGAANVARVLGYKERQMIKTLVFETDRGDHALVMLGGDQNIVSGKLKKALRSRNISLAKPDVVQRVTGYQIGSIPPFHWQPPGFRSLMDAALMSEEILGVGAGVWGEEIMITPENLVRAAAAQIVDLC